MTLSTTARAALQAVNDNQGLLVLLKIDHAALSAPLRLVSDTRNITTLGDTYVGIQFEVTPPSDVAGESPRAQLRIDNTGRDLTFELERLPPGVALMGTLIYVYRATPSVIEYWFTVPLTNLHVDIAYLTATMGPDGLMRRPAVLLRFDPTTAPGLYPD